MSTADLQRGRCRAVLALRLVGGDHDAGLCAWCAHGALDGDGQCGAGWYVGATKVIGCYDYEGSA